MINMKRDILSLSDFRLRLGEEYAEAYELWCKGVRFYRADADRGTFSVERPAFRTSLNTGNEYTFLISEFLPSWKDFPKRNRCIIGAGNKEAAEEYMAPGNALYCLFPRNGALLAVAPTADMWDSFSLLRNNFDIPSIDIFNSRLADMLSRLCGEADITFREIDEIFRESVPAAVSAIFCKAEENFRKNNSSAKIKFWWENEAFADFIVSGLLRGMNLVYLLDELLSPSKNGFQLTPLSKVKKFETEFWTDSQCLFVKECQLSLFDCRK